MNGYELARAIKADADSARIPLIALTTRFNEVDQKLGMNAGFDRYLEKLKSDELIEAIYELLGVRS